MDSTYRTLGWLCLVVGINQLGFGSIVPIVPTFARSFGVSQAAAGLVISVYGLGRLLFDLPMGGLAERVGRRKIIIIGEIITTVGSLLCAVAGTLPLLILFRFIGGIGAATVLTGAQVVLADITTPHTRARMMNIYQAIFLCAVGIGPSLGGVVADAFGTPAPFYTFGFLSLLAALVCFLRVPETRHLAIARAAAAKQVATPMRQTLRILLRQRGFLLIGLVTFVQYFARTGALYNLVPIIGRDRLGLSASATGFAISIASLMNFATIPLSAIMMHRWGRRGGIIPGTMICGAAFACLAVAFNYPIYIAGMFLWGLGGGVGGSAPAAYAADMAPPGANGVTMGIYLTLADAGYVVGPFLLGWISDRAGMDTALFVTVGLFAIAVTLFALFAPETVYGRNRRTPKEVAVAAD
ncbi:MAG: MFS transporter [Chloroflexota bacterium]|nr:MFS transporter [Chloroflexota bacterium]